MRSRPVKLVSRQSSLLSIIVASLVLSAPLQAFAQATTPADSSTAPLTSDVKSFVALPFLWAVERGREGNYAVTGYVPTKQFQAFVQTRLKDIEVDSSQIADGAPDGFITEALAGISALAKADDGRVSFSGSTWALLATVSSTEQRQAVIDQLRTDGAIENWKYTVEVIKPALPTATPYSWRARKTADGNIELSGFVPTPELQRFLSVRISETGENRTQLAVGAPDNFITDALAALTVAHAISAGEAGYDGDKWYVTGEGASDDIAAALASAHTPVTEWVITENDADTAVSTQTAPAAQDAETAEAVTAEEQVIDPQNDNDENTTIEQPAIAEEENIEATTATAAQDDVEPQSEPQRYRFSAQKPLDGQIGLLGVVPADAARRYFGVLAGKVPTDGLYLYDGAPDGFIEAATVGLRALALLEEGQLLHERGRWSLSGLAENEARADSISTNIAALANSDNWALNIDIVPPIVICTEHVDALAAQNNILFAAGSARLADSSLSEIDQLAIFLEECPDAIVHVEGHTDADGAEALNLALSVARAEAVVNALIDRDVLASRLYAIGYGESLPIASNDTNAGKRQNRRIVFKILEEHR